MKAKIINEKGKLFGIINIIDLLVLLVAVVAVFAGVKFFKNGGFAALNAEDNEVFSGPETTLQLKFYSEEVSDFVASQLEVGAALYDESSTEPLGHLTGIETARSDSYAANSEGQFVLAGREGYVSAIITGEVEGQRTPLGATVGKTHYAAGHTFVLRAGDAKIYLRVYSVESKPRRLRRPLPTPETV